MVQVFLFFCCGFSHPKQPAFVAHEMSSRARREVEPNVAAAVAAAHVVSTAVIT